jgi:hypothetical protein
VLEKVALTSDLVDEDTRDCLGATSQPIPHPEEESAAIAEVTETRASKPIIRFFIKSSLNYEYLLTE